MKQTFEESMTQLEAIVKKLEKNEASLEESLELFEKGIKLSKQCQKMLDDADKRVSVLVDGDDGEKEIREFSPANE